MASSRRHIGRSLQFLLDFLLPLVGTQAWVRSCSRSCKYPCLPACLGCVSNSQANEFEHERDVGYFADGGLFWIHLGCQLFALLERTAASASLVGWFLFSCCLGAAAAGASFFPFFTPAVCLWSRAWYCALVP